MTLHSFSTEPHRKEGGKKPRIIALWLQKQVRKTFLLNLVTCSSIVGVKRGVCSQINHFPEDADFDHDGAEYVLRKSTLDY